MMNSVTTGNSESTGSTAQASSVSGLAGGSAQLAAGARLESTANSTQESVNGPEPGPDKGPDTGPAQDPQRESEKGPEEDPTDPPIEAPDDTPAPGEEPIEEPGDDSDKLNLMQVLGSVLAAGLGVQSSKNRERDFKQGRAGTFILAGLIFTALFIGSVYTVVSIVLSNR